MELSYSDVGSGDCVVLIHGHPFDRSLWEPQLAGLRDNFRVLAPGHAGLRRGSRKYAADVEGLLDGLGITRAAVVGLSMGGLVTMELAVSRAGALLGDGPRRHHRGTGDTARTGDPAPASRRGRA